MCSFLSYRLLFRRYINNSGISTSGFLSYHKFRYEFGFRFIHPSLSSSLKSGFHRLPYSRTFSCTNTPFYFSNTLTTMASDSKNQGSIHDFTVKFGAQEPGSNEEIVEFVCTRFKAEYPIFDKVDVNGENASPAYKFLKASKGSIGDKIKWNFSKFLVDQEGHVVDRYSPPPTPLSIEDDIKKLLKISSYKVFKTE